jgi:hypothetical protein
MQNKAKCRLEGLPCNASPIHTDAPQGRTTCEAGLEQGTCGGVPVVDPVSKHGYPRPEEGVCRHRSTNPRKYHRVGYGDDHGSTVPWQTGQCQPTLVFWRRCCQFVNNTNLLQRARNYCVREVDREQWIAQPQHQLRYWVE